MKKIRWVSSAVLLLMVIILLIPNIALADNKPDNNTKIEIETTKTEAMEIGELLKDRGYQIDENGDFSLSATYTGTAIKALMNKLKSSGVKDMRKPIIIGIIFVSTLIGGVFATKAYMEKQVEKNAKAFNPVSLSNRVKSNHSPINSTSQAFEPSTQGAHGDSFWQSQQSQPQQSSGNYHYNEPVNNQYQNINNQQYNNQYMNHDNGEPVIEYKRDYSQYDDRNQSVFIKQSSMYQE